MILVEAGLSKLIFIALVLTYGRQYLGHQVGMAIGFDAVVVAIFIVYLSAICRGQAAE